MQKLPLLKTVGSHFPLVWLMECTIYIYTFGLSQSFSDISSLPILVKAKLLHENGKRILCISNGLNSCAFVYKLSGCRIDSCGGYLKRQKSHLFQVRSSLHSGNYRVCGMLRTHSYTVTGPLCFIKVFHLQQS